MTRATLLAGMLFAAAATWTAIAFGGGGEATGAPGSPPPSSEPAHAWDASAETVSLGLGGGEVQVTYPIGLALAVTPEQLLVTAMLPACSQPFDYCLYLPEEEFVGTNLSSAGLRISARTDLTAETSCLLAQPAGWSDMQPGVLREDLTSTSRFGDLGEGAAGSYSHAELYRLWTGENCYEFETRQVLTRFEHYEPGAVTEFTTTDQRALEHRFITVLGSVVMADGEPISWPLAGTSELQEFVQLHAPLRGEPVTSPLTIAGQAVGTWFFEGSFPLELISTAGEAIAVGYVTAEAEWMTTELVRFGGVLEFEVSGPTEAVLVLRRDNPSDLREHDAAVRVPLTLMPE